MTSEIYRETSSFRGSLKQPEDLRYALYCLPTFRYTAKIECDSQSRLGHLGDFIDDFSAVKAGITHPHPVLIVFFPH